MAQLKLKLSPWDINIPSNLPGALENLFGVAKLTGDTSTPPNPLYYFKSEISSIVDGGEYQFTIVPLVIPKNFIHLDITEVPISTQYPEGVKITHGSTPLAGEFTGNVLLRLSPVGAPLVSKIFGQHHCIDGILKVGGKACARLSALKSIPGFNLNNNYYILADLHDDRFLFAFITSNEQGLKNTMRRWFDAFGKPNADKINIAIDSKLVYCDPLKILWAEGIGLYFADFITGRRWGTDENEDQSVPLPLPDQDTCPRGA